MADTIRETTERFAREKIAPIAAEIDETDEFPRQLWPQMGELGLHGITVEGTAIKELEEETGFTAERVERLGEFYSSPGMLSEAFTLVRGHGVRKIGEGGGDENEDINVHLVPRSEIPNFIEQKRAEGFGVDVKLLLFLNS